MYYAYLFLTFWLTAFGVQQHVEAQYKMIKVTAQKNFLYLAGCFICSSLTWAMCACISNAYTYIYTYRHNLETRRTWSHLLICHDFWNSSSISHCMKELYTHLHKLCIEKNIEKTKDFTCVCRTKHVCLCIHTRSHTYKYASAMETT
jgi:hypothetical protein